MHVIKGGGRVMDWTDVGQIVLCAVGSAGGIGVIIIGVIKWSANKIADGLTKKYEIKLQKEIEKFKANVENKIYISKTKFDAEFQLYRQLSKVCTNMVKIACQLFPIVTKDVDEDYEKSEKLYLEARDAVVVAQDEIYSSVPFISAELYEKFSNLENLCKIQLSCFEDFRLRPDAKEFRTQCRDEFNNVYKRTREITECFENLLENMRCYLVKLDVFE